MRNSLVQRNRNDEVREGVAYSCIMGGESNSDEIFPSFSHCLGDDGRFELSDLQDWLSAFLDKLDRRHHQIS